MDFIVYFGTPAEGAVNTTYACYRTDISGNILFPGVQVINGSLVATEREIPKDPKSGIAKFSNVDFLKEYLPENTLEAAKNILRC